MQRQTVSIFIALASAAVLASAIVNCGGPQINMEQLANSPGLHTTNPFSITVAGKTVSYKADTVEANYDPSTHVLSLYVFGDSMADNSWLQHTTCDFSTYTSGDFVIVRFKDFDPTKTGTYSATDADVLVYPQTPGGQPVTTKGALDGVTLTVTKTNNDRIVGTFSGGGASGGMDAWPCFVDGGPGGAPTPAPTASAAPADSAVTPASSSTAPADAGAADDASTATPSKKKKKKKSGG
jgi:hypothetical protein